MDTNILNSWSETIFKSLQPLYDGGIFTPLIQEEQFNVTEVWLWLQRLAFRPYYNVTIVIGAIWTLFIPLILLLFLLSFCRKNCLCCYKCVRQVQRGINGAGRICFGRKQLVNELPNRRLDYKKGSDKFRATYATLVCCFLCLIGLCGGLYYTIFESYQVQYFLSNDDNDTQSFKIYKDEAILQAKAFLKDGISNANDTTAEWIEVFNGKLNTAMLQFVKILSDDMYTQFGVYPTLDTSETILGKITTVLNAMKYISGNRTLKNNASFLEGKFKTMRDFTHTQLQNCPPQISSECIAFAKLSKQLTTNINWNIIDFDTSTSIINFIKQFNFNLIELEAGISNSRAFLKFYDFHFRKDALKIVSDANILDTISKMWTSADDFLNKEVISLMDRLITDEPEQPYLAQASKFWRMITDFAWSLCLTFAVIVFITWLLVVSKIGFTLNYAKQKARRKKYVVNLQALYTNKKTTAIDVAVEKMNQQADEPEDEVLSSMCFYGVLRFLYITSGIILLVPCIITVAAFLVSGVLTTEVCRYMVDGAGVKVVDRKIDLFIKRIWDNEITKLNISSYINLKCPSHVLHGIFQTCRKPNVSIIESLQMNGLFNASEFARAPLFSKLIDSGFAVVKNNYDGLQTKNLIPTSIIKHIDDGVDFMKRLIDGKNYLPSIKELSKPFLKLNLTDYVHRLEELAMKLSNLKPHVSIIKADASYLSSIETNITNLRKQFQNLQKHNNLSGDLLDLKTMILTTASKLQNKTLQGVLLPIVYNQSVSFLMGKIITELQTGVNDLERRFFPCQQLHEAYSISMRAVCGDLRSGMGAFALALAITMIWFQLCFLFSWCLVSVLKPPSKCEDCTTV